MPRTQQSLDSEFQCQKHVEADLAIRKKLELLKKKRKKDKRRNFNQTVHRLRIEKNGFFVYFFFGFFYIFFVDFFIKVLIEQLARNNKQSDKLKDLQLVLECQV